MSDRPPHRDRRESTGRKRATAPEPDGSGQRPVPDPQRRNAAYDMFAADVASRALGIELIEAAAGAAVARMRVTGAMVNGHRIAHGGYLFLLADTAFALACNSHGPVTVAAGGDIVFVRPAREGDVLLARAAERIRYGRSGIYDVTVTRDDGAVIAEFRGRSRTLNGA
ncbi:hydroxyphenylacetyl-CoA thioesterase PaaI [Salinispora tropica]|uniref:hydroxyphenylacetyl-CoA thioesterase PaaI n=1 Tax=Salinispora tropica TaxID=168695 RepID=UPI00048B2998